NSDGSFSYLPAPNYNGSDSFQYRVFDGTLYSNVATVTIAITPVNDAPIGQNDNYSTAEDGNLDVAAPGILTNDIDIDTPSNALTVQLVTAPPNAAQNGFQLNSDGSFTYSPKPDFNGVDTFTYRVSDGALYSNVAMVQITVTGTNDAPQA